MKHCLKETHLKILFLSCIVIFSGIQAVFEGGFEGISVREPAKIEENVNLTISKVEENLNEIQKAAHEKNLKEEFEAEKKEKVERRINELKENIEIYDNFYSRYDKLKTIETPTEALVKERRRLEQDLLTINKRIENTQQRLSENIRQMELKYGVQLAEIFEIPEGEVPEFQKIASEEDVKNFERLTTIGKGYFTRFRPGRPTQKLLKLNSLAEGILSTLEDRAIDLLGEKQAKNIMQKVRASQPSFRPREADKDAVSALRVVAEDAVNLRNKFEKSTLTPSDVEKRLQFAQEIRALDEWYQKVITPIKTLTRRLGGKPVTLPDSLVTLVGLEKR